MHDGNRRWWNRVCICSVYQALLSAFCSTPFSRLGTWLIKALEYGFFELVFSTLYPSINLSKAVRYASMSSYSVNLFSCNLPAPESILAPGSIPLVLAGSPKVGRMSKFISHNYLVAIIVLQHSV